MRQCAIDLEGMEGQLAQLVERARRGEDVILARDGEPVARIVPITRSKRARRFGSARGKVILHPEFDAPVDPFDEGL